LVGIAERIKRVPALGGGAGRLAPARPAAHGAPRHEHARFAQRFGGALNLNVHFRCVIPAGVFVWEDGAVRFVELAPPSDEEVMAVLRHVVVRLERLPRLATREADARPLDALGAAQAEAMNSPGRGHSTTGGRGSTRHT
jgi:hypothetical protein